MIFMLLNQTAAVMSQSRVAWRALMTASYKMHLTVTTGDLAEFLHLSESE